jgi:hypothetical protein
MAMTTDQHLNESFDILLGELMADDELRDAFLRDPEGTLEVAGDWALPLSESELQRLRAPAHRPLDRVTDALEARWLAAA